MMIMLHVLIPVGSPQVHCSRSVGLVYKSVERSVVPKVESGTRSSVNFFGASYEADAL